MLTWLTLFGSCFLAATILPFYSEAVLVALLRSGEAVWLLWLVATLGNTLGAAVNWALGRWALHWQHKRWFPASPKQLERGQRWFQRFGVWSLLLAWLPVGGDALTLFAGIMRVRFDLFFVLTFIGKGVRYWLVIATAQAVLA